MRRSDWTFHAIIHDVEECLTSHLRTHKNLHGSFSTARQRKPRCLLPRVVFACFFRGIEDRCVQYEQLRGEKLNYNSCTSLLLRKYQNLLFLAPEVRWALKVYRVCSIHVFFKCFEPCPYLVCHVNTIENV